MNAERPLVALVTFAAHPELTADDQLLADALVGHGVAGHAVAWDSDADWDGYGAIVLRSCWDYHRRLPAFLGWLDRLDAAGVTVCNPVHVVRWNADKRYLRDLELLGVPVVPTWWCERSDDATLAAVLADTGWDAVVIKPSVSASAQHTWRTSRSAAREDDARFRALRKRGTVLVQPFVSAVTDDGEWSLVFIAGVYSHAVLKRPRADDFRVQHEHGGGAVLAVPSAATIEQAEAALAAVGTFFGSADRAAFLYARVDGCVVDGTFVLMELELIEPALFLGEAPGAAERLATALVRKLSPKL